MVFLQKKKKKRSLHSWWPLDSCGCRESWWSCSLCTNSMRISQCCGFTHRSSVNFNIRWLRWSILTRWVPHDGYIRHQNDHLSGRMTDISVMGEWQVVGVVKQRDSATLECFGRGYRGTIFVRSSKWSLFFPELRPFRRVFLFPALLKDLAPNVQALGLLVRRCFGALFENSAPSPGIFCQLLLRPQVFLENFLSFFPKQSRFYLPDSYDDPKSEQSTLVMAHRENQNENATSGRWQDRAQKDHRSSSRLVQVVCDDPWSRREKTKTRKSACDCAKAQPFIIYKPASFEEPVSETRRRYRFALSCFRGRGWTAAGRSGCSAERARGEGRRRMNTFSILIHWKSQTSLKLNCESTNRISSTLPRLRRCLATNSANLSQNIILLTIHRTTCGSSRGTTYATLSPTPGTVRARLQMTEARTERLQPTLHGKTIGSTIKTSRKEKKTCQRQRSERLASLSLGELVGSSSPKLESPSFPRAHAWSAAVFHALYHYSDETGPYTQSKKGFLRHLAGILWQSLACITSMTAWPSDSKIQTVARKPAAVAIFPSGRARNVLDRRAVVVNSNMSRGKYLAREGPGSRLVHFQLNNPDTKARQELRAFTAGRRGEEKRNFRGPKRQLFLQNEGLFNAPPALFVYLPHTRKWRCCRNHNYQKINPLSAIWRIYPSSKWSSQWPYDGYIRHGCMTSCGRGRHSATPECFGRGSQGTIFVRSSKISLFLPELCSFRRVFLFPALL